MFGGLNINDVIVNELKNHGADIIRFVDISSFPDAQTLGFDKAILFCMILSKTYLIDRFNNLPMDMKNDEYLEKEHKVEALADWLADFIEQMGYRAHSQSEKNNMECGYIERAYIDPEMQQGISILPQKSIARAAGLGFIGKNNLLVTKDYGCAFCMCSVLTDIPVITSVYTIIQPDCGACESCVKACPANALHGSEWSKNGGRESVVDVSKCCCALKCMVFCPWSLKYAGIYKE